MTVSIMLRQVISRLASLDMWTLGEYTSYTDLGGQPMGHFDIQDILDARAPRRSEPTLPSHAEAFDPEMARRLRLQLRTHRLFMSQWVRALIP